MFGDDVREHASEQAADVIEALQARVLESQEHWEAMNKELKHVIAERDTLAAKLASLEGQDSVGCIVPIDGWKENSTANRMATFHGDIPDEGAQLYLAAGAQAQPLTAEQRRDIWNDVKYDHGDGWEVDFSAVVDAVEAAHKIGGSV
jgi:hypothetical protein